MTIWAGTGDRRLGVWGHLVFLIWALVMIGVLPTGRLLWLAGAIILFAAIDGVPIWPTLTNWRLWAFLCSIIVISAFFLGPADMQLWFFQISSQGLWAGFWMAVRALCITLAFGVTIGALSVSQLSSLFETFGLKGIGFAFGVALNMMTLLGDVVSTTYHSCRLRGGFRRRIIFNSGRFLIGVITNALRHGDEVVIAASARAFDPSARRPSSQATCASCPEHTRAIPITPMDGMLLVVLAGLSVLFLL